jgi:hypothetical protein
MEIEVVRLLVLDLSTILNFYQRNQLNLRAITFFYFPQIPLISQIIFSSMFSIIVVCHKLLTLRKIEVVRSSVLKFTNSANFFLESFK